MQHGAQRPCCSVLRWSFVVLTAIVVSAFVWPTSVVARAQDDPEESAGSLEIGLSTLFPGDKISTTLLVEVGDIVPVIGTTAPLLDAGGRPSGMVAIREPALCADQAPRIVRVGSSVWCLEVIKAVPGKPLTSTVASGDAAFKLTLKARHNLPVPLVVAAISTVAGFSLAVITARTPGRINERRLRELAKTAEGSPYKIAGMVGWTLSRRVEEPADGLYLKVRALMQTIPIDADRWRSKLRSLLADINKPKLPELSSQLGPAHHEAHRTSSQIGEFFQDNGDPVIHPAARWGAAAELLVAIGDLLADVERQLPLFLYMADTTLNENLKQSLKGSGPPDAGLELLGFGAPTREKAAELDRRLRTQQERLGTLILCSNAAPSRPTDQAIEELKSIRRDLRAIKVEGAVLPPGLGAGIAFGAPEPSISESKPPGELQLEPLEDLVRQHRLDPLQLPVVWIWLAIITAFGLANRWAPNSTFATFADYTSLVAVSFSAAAVSAAVAIFTKLDLALPDPVPDKPDPSRAVSPTKSVA